MTQERLAVLVTDGQERAALAVVRSLGRAGHRVFVCSPAARSLAGASRHALQQARVPDALAAPDAFVAAVQRLLSDWQINVIVPISEAALLALLPERARLTGVCMPFASSEQFRRICDKETVLQAATEIGIATPSQRTVAYPDDRVGFSPDGLQFPVVVKPARSVADGAGARIKSGVTHVANRRALCAALASYRPESYPLLLQQRIDGPGIGIFLLLWDDETLAVFAHRRIREKPPGGGVSVYCESIAADPELLERSRRLLEHFGWQGVAMVEYKVDRASGTPYLMEINGRFWGSLQLAIDAGVDFPALLVAAALGRRPEPVLRYRLGIRSRWWWGDVDHLLTRLRRSDEQSALLPETPSRWRAIVDFLKVWQPGDRNEVFRTSDPLPFARESIDWFLGRGT